MLAFRIFQDSALKLRAVPEDEEGIDIKYLKIQLEESKAKARTTSSHDQVSTHEIDMHSCAQVPLRRLPWLPSPPRLTGYFFQPHTVQLSCLLPSLHYTQSTHVLLHHPSAAVEDG